MSWQADSIIRVATPKAPELFTEVSCVYISFNLSFLSAGTNACILL